MTRRTRSVWLLLLAIALVAPAAGCRNGSSDGLSHGIVKSIDAEARKVTLDHEDIPGLMQAMTMTFDVAPGVPLGDLQAGVEVEFRVEEADGSYIVTEIRGTGS